MAWEPSEGCKGLLQFRKHLRLKEAIMNDKFERIKEIDKRYEFKLAARALAAIDAFNECDAEFPRIYTGSNDDDPAVVANSIACHEARRELGAALAEMIKPFVKLVDRANGIAAATCVTVGFRFYSRKTVNAEPAKFLDHLAQV
jgi:hypothetical protein